MEKLKSRLPSRDAILPVFAVISFMVYGWTLIVFMWKVPSWMMFLPFGEILVVLAYSMAACLLESLTALGILLLVCLVLPAAWMSDIFITRGSIAVLFGLGTIMFFMYRFSVVGYSYLVNLINWSLLGFAVTLLFTFLAPRLRIVVRAAAWLSDRLIVFLFLLLPTSLVSLLVVIYRNLF